MERRLLSEGDDADGDAEWFSSRPDRRRNASHRNTSLGVVRSSENNVIVIEGWHGTSLLAL